MIVDSSAMLAVVLGESDWQTYLQRILAAPDRALSAANYLEIGIVSDNRVSREAALELDAFLANLRISIEPVTAAHARTARRAYAKYGKGRHAAALNFGDCFAYALSKDTGRPLLFKGDDFGKTDVLAAL